jgi:hypothetical protein
MKTIKIRNIPQWSICYLAYGDDSGLTTEDRKLVDDFLLDLHREGWQLCEGPIEGSENAFCRYPLFGLACSTVDYEAYKIEKKEHFTKEQKENFARFFHFAN